MSTRFAASTATSRTTNVAKSPSGTGMDTGSGATACTATRCTSTARFPRARSFSMRRRLARRVGAREQKDAFATVFACSGQTARPPPRGCFHSPLCRSARTASRSSRASSARRPIRLRTTWILRSTSPWLPVCLGILAANLLIRRMGLENASSRPSSGGVSPGAYFQ